MSWTLRAVGTFTSSNSGTVSAQIVGVQAGDLLLLTSVLYSATQTITGASVAGDSALSVVPSSNFTGAVGGSTARVELWWGIAGSTATKDFTITNGTTGSPWSCGMVIAFAPTAGTVSIDGAAAGVTSTGNATLVGLIADSISVGVHSRGTTPPTPTNYTSFATDDPVESSAGFYRLSVPGGDEVIALDAVGVAVAFKITAAASNVNIAWITA